MRSFIISLVLASCFFAAQAQKTYLYCGQLIDVEHLKVLKEKTIVVEGNKIVEVLDGYTKAGSNDKTVDLKNSTVMPGLMDMHVHVENETSPNRYLDGFTQNDVDVAYGALRLVERDLMAGFTSVRDRWLGRQHCFKKSHSKRICCWSKNLYCW